MKLPFRRRKLMAAAAALSVLGAAAPFVLGTHASGASPPAIPAQQLAKMSSIWTFVNYVQHPDQAPAGQQQIYQSIQTSSQNRVSRSFKVTPNIATVGSALRLNKDTTGTPQNETTSAVCPATATTVGNLLGGYNDFRYFFAGAAGLTGWTLASLPKGFPGSGSPSVLKDGQIPPVLADGVSDISRGDPVAGTDPSCNLFMAGLADGFGTPGSDSAIEVSKTTPATLNAATCTSGAPTSCWPTNVAAAHTLTAPTSLVNTFLDKPWMAVGMSSGTEYVWVTYTRFITGSPGSQTNIEAVRCLATLASCSAPIVLESVSASGGTPYDQFSYVVIGADGRTYVSWIQNVFNSVTSSYNYVLKLRIAPAGSTTFGVTQTVTTITKPMSSFGFVKMSDNDFRTDTVPAMAEKAVTIGGTPTHRIFLTWAECGTLVLGFPTLCENPVIKLAHADSASGTTTGAWTIATWFSSNDNVQPSIAADPTSAKLALDWYSTNYDPGGFHHRLDVVLSSIDPVLVTGSTARITTTSDEPEADPLDDLYFPAIGDYQQVITATGTAYMHFTGHYTSMTFLGAGIPIPQEDTYLMVATL
jgi:hypothetical protein